MMRVVFLLTAAAIASAACSSSAAPATPAPATTAASTSAAAATPAPTTAAATASGPNIADLLKAGKATSYKATYRWSITAGGQTTNSEQTWYVKGGNSRFDFSAAPGASISVYSIADGTYICTNAGGTSFCQKSAPGAAFGQNPAADFALQFQGDPTKFNAAFTGSQSIAGQQAQCYTVQSVAGGAFGDVNTCYSSNGVPLKTTITSSGTTMTTEATAFSTNVSDADFTLPAAAR